MIVEWINNGTADSLTALYTLERLANDNPGHRQTIVNIICAYLRMPWTPPDQAARPRADTIRDHHRAYKAAKAGRPAVPPATPADAREEHQVRLTAQRLLTDHLQEASASTGHRFWKNINLDLTGATLTDLDFKTCTIRNARFVGATFTGGAWFEAATFTGGASFVDATFTEDASFMGAAFTGDAWFAGATFTWPVWFGGATFTEGAVFKGVSFGGKVSWPLGWALNQDDGTLVKDPSGA